MRPIVGLSLALAASSPPCTILRVETALVTVLSAAAKPSPPDEQANEMWYLAAQALKTYAQTQQPQVREHYLYQLNITAQASNTMRNEIPDLYAVAKYSFKRNGKLSSTRSMQRCLVELLLLVGTFAVLSEHERRAFVHTIRPVARGAPTGQRLASLTLLCRGFYSPGFGGKNGWRKKSQLDYTGLAIISEMNGALESSIRFQRVVSTSENAIRSQSRLLRSVFPFLAFPGAVWSFQQVCANNSTELPHEEAYDWFNDTSNLLLILAQEGEEGAACLRTLRDWVVSSLSRAARRDDNKFSCSRIEVEPFPFIISTHGALIRGKRRSRLSWLRAVGLIGHTVSLMHLAATESMKKRNFTYSEENASPVEAVRALALAYTVLDLSECVEKFFHFSLSNGALTPDGMLQLLDEVMHSDIEEEVATDRNLMKSVGWSSCLSQLSTWRAPHVLFKYIRLHGSDDEVGSLVRRWALALFNASFEDLHQLRCHASPNIDHFNRISSSTPGADRAVSIWIAADAAECGPRNTESTRGILLGTCAAEKFLMMGEESGSCLRLEDDCAPQNVALLGCLTQGNVRLIEVRTNGKLEVRSTVRLLARSDNGMPVLFIDQPVYAGRDAGLGGVEISRREIHKSKLVQQALIIGDHLEIPVAFWCDCRPIGTPHSGHVRLIEHNGLSPVVYCNLSGMIRRPEASKGGSREITLAEWLKG